MTNITYNGIEIDLDALNSYLASIKKSREKHTYVDIEDSYAGNLLNSIMLSLSENNIQFDEQNSYVGALLEKVIREVGYDKNGHYSPEAHKAMKNLNIKRGFAPDFIELSDIRIEKGWKQKLHNFTSSLKSKISAFNKPFKKLWENGKKYIFGALGIGVFATSGFMLKPVSGLFDTTNKSSQPKEIKADLDMDSAKVLSGTVFWHEVAQDTVAKDTSRQDSLKTLENIIENKNNYYRNVSQTKAANKTKASAKTANDENDAYVSALQILMSDKAYQKLDKQVTNQLKEGIFKLEEGITKERLMHAYKMCQTYKDFDKSGTAIVLNAVNSQQKLTAEQQAQLTDYILNDVGPLGTTLMETSIQKGNNNKHSCFNHASKAKQMQHIKNLKQLRDLHNR